MSRNSASSVQYRPASRVVRAVIYATDHADIRLTGAYFDE